MSTFDLFDSSPTPDESRRRRQMVEAVMENYRTAILPAILKRIANSKLGEIIRPRPMESHLPAGATDQNPAEAMPITWTPMPAAFYGVDEFCYKYRLPAGATKANPTEAIMVECRPGLYQKAIALLNEDQPPISKPRSWGNGDGDRIHAYRL